MAYALCIIPGNGSVWVIHAVRKTYPEGVFIEGDIWDTNEVGCSYLPDDYRGEYIPIGFPESHLLKWEKDEQEN